MAITFPLSAQAFIDLLTIENATFKPSRNDQLSGLGNGQPLNTELASPLWQVDVSTGPIPNDDAEAIAALIERLEQPGNDFYVYNPRKLGPRMDRDGSILGAATPTIHTLASNNHQIRVDGLPSGYVLSRGDMLAFEYGPTGQKRRAMHRIDETVTASGAGLSPLFEVFPHIRPGAAVGDPVFLAPAAMRAKIIPGSYSITQVGALHQRLSFSAIQKLI
ncbi:hypothetical protein [Pelagibacterium lentulum]|uniref:Uncharacterized protein n=1 Tax=Pelagibacterium lentulum TaxID=2029865 RepID=A0A916W4J4_9HYPH|nr:hypothetical protein [Pelagibacterium lentulum]GGA65003.1 hypothetical protein GCM10011499_39320 [Pelagibacterium lentulum]